MYMSPIRTLQKRFQRNPANYIIEAELSFELKHLLNERLDQARFHGEHDLGGAEGTLRDHSEYADAILEAEHIDRAHCEVRGDNIGVRDVSSQVDVVVFDESIVLRLDNGSKKFRAHDLEAAYELKLVHNQKYLRTASDRYEQVFDDIAELSELPDHVEKHVLFFANFGMLRRDIGREAFSDFQAAEDDVSVHYADPLHHIFGSESQ